MLPTLLWTTDVHLDHLPLPESAFHLGKVFQGIAPEARGLIVTGDIASARSIVEVLRQLYAGYEGPIYFVLGNHDYYGGKFRVVDEKVNRLVQEVPGLTWLRNESVILDVDVALVGTCGWYDVRYGNPDSPLQMSDFMVIDEVLEAQDESRAAMHALFRARADELAKTFEAQARSVLLDPRIKKVLCATHVPPFPESCWHKGEISDGTWTPYFTSKATGDALLRLSRDFPDIEWTVLCGHTHGEGVVEMSNNLTVYTGGASYGAPALAGTITLAAHLEVSLMRSPENSDSAGNNS